MPRVLLVAVAIVALLMLGGCGGAGLSAGEADDQNTSEPVTDIAGTVDLTLTNDDVDCSPETLAESDERAIITAHYVVDGALGAVCLGEEDPTLTRAFTELAAIAPPLQLTDIGLFAGYVWEGDTEEATLAYVLPIDDDGFQFAMAAELNNYDDDPDEARLTMAHEFAHVFTETITQLDRSAEPDDCLTFWNGSGCYLDDSLMNAWIEAFWPDDVLEEVDVDAEAEIADGVLRCDTDDSFFGVYAASNPEEDFAEAFAAYVYDLEANTDGQQLKLDWIDAQPGLRTFRQRAEAADLTPLDNNSDTCG